MAKKKRAYVFATCFLSGAAAILSFVALGTRTWISARLELDVDETHHNTMNIGLFSAVFHQHVPWPARYELSTVCAWDLNICGLLCGDNPEENLRKLYKNEPITDDYESSCGAAILTDSYYNRIIPRASNTNTEKIFINTGMWFCTILFLIISAVMGLFSAALAIWNTATSPYQVYLSIFGLYVYNAIAFFSILLSIILYGAMFVKDLRNNIPTYKTYVDDFVTINPQLGYSYWINLASLFLYMMSISLLYIRNYLISKEPKVNVQLEDSEYSALSSINN